jgi:hypothetical protein
MSKQWLWKPVIVGAVVCAVLGCLFIGYVIAILTCPGLMRTCLSSTHTLFVDIFHFGWPSVLTGGLVGAGLGALFAVIRKRVRGNG